MNKWPVNFNIANRWYDANTRPIDNKILIVMIKLLSFIVSEGIMSKDVVKQTMDIVPTTILHTNKNKKK